MFRETEQRLKPEIQKALDLKKEIENIEERYQEYVSKLNNQSTSYEELHRLYTTRQEHESNLEKKRAGVLEGYQKLKEEINRLLTDISNKDLEIVTAKESLNELDQLIISSPEKIGADVQKIKDSIKDLEHKIHAKEVDRNDHKKRNQSVLLTQEELLKYCNKQQKLLEEIQSITEDVQNIYSLEQKCVEEHRMLEESKSAIEMKDTMLKFYAQKLSTIQQSSEQETEKMLETIKSLQRQITDEDRRLKEFGIVESQLKEKIDKTACSVINVVENSKKAKAETEKIKAMYKKEKQNLITKFSESCKEVSDVIKQRYGRK